MTPMWFPLLIGLLGSAHCLGMCGPIVVASSLKTGGPLLWSRESDFRSRLEFLALQTLFHFGRLVTYSILGGVAALFTHAAQILFTSSSAHSILTSAYGVLLILFGLALMKTLPIPAACASMFSNPLSGIMHRIPGPCNVRHPGAMFLLGLLTGLLPCCLSWSMVITAASTGNFATGILMMLSFGAGTIPALFLAGLSASFLTRLYRRMGESLPGLILVGAGSYLVLKGTGVVG